MSSTPLSDSYCTISEAAEFLKCTEEKVVRMLEQGEIEALLNAEFDSILGYKRHGYCVIDPAVILIITSKTFDTVRFKSIAGHDCEASASLENVRICVSSLPAGANAKRKWSAQKLAMLLVEQSELKSSNCKNPTATLAERHDVSDSFIRKMLSAAREMGKAPQAEAPRPPATLQDTWLRPKR